MKKSLFIECGPILCERQFTGIPSVNYHLVKDAINRFGNDDVICFHGPHVINKNAVDDILKCRTNEPAETYKEKGNLFVGNLRDRVKSKKYSIGIFTNSRHGLGRMFNYECQVFHDLTPIITPEFHNVDTIEFHAHEYQRDIGLLDCAICVSESTKKDVVSYLGLAEKNILVSHLGVDGLSDEIISTISAISSAEVEPYIIIIGTIEPRKNHKRVFEYLARNPEVLDRYKLVVVGRSGWGTNFESLMSIIGDLTPDRRAKVIQLGFVSEKLKAALIAKAKFSIYPSYYEGFGLPVIESLALGCPVLGSFSSSIPEVGGGVCEYFNPDSTDSFSEAFDILEARVQSNQGQLRRCSIEWASQFTWDKFCSRIYKHVKFNSVKNRRAAR